MSKYTNEQIAGNEGLWNDYYNTSALMPFDEYSFDERLAALNAGYPDVKSLDDIDTKNMSRDEAIALVGMAAVTAAEADNCVPTDRAYDHDEGEIEWAGWAGVDYDTLTPEQIYQLPVDGCCIRAIYYTDADDAEQVEDNGGDWSVLTWTVHHYEIF